MKRWRKKIIVRCCGVPTSVFVCCHSLTEYIIFLCRFEFEVSDSAQRTVKTSSAVFLFAGVFIREHRGSSHLPPLLFPGAVHLFTQIHIYLQTCRHVRKLEPWNNCTKCWVFSFCLRWWRKFSVSIQFTDHT